MESVEVWMWVIAGLVIGIIVFTAGYSFITRYMINVEKGQAADALTMLSQKIQNTCQSSLYSRESKNIIFPHIVQRVYVRTKDMDEGMGDYVCIDVQNELPECNELKCAVTMNTINTASQTTTFYLIQKALGRSKASNIKFDISNTGSEQVSVDWKPQILG